MDTRKINNLWKFLGIKNNLSPDIFVNQQVNYRFVKDNMVLIHQFNPHFWQESALIISQKYFQERNIVQQYHHKGKIFGVKSFPTSTHVSIFFPKELLRLKNDFEIDINKDHAGHYQTKISPFVPKNVYYILDKVNFITKILWNRDFFSESLRN
ncbi:hypothetical protein QWY93_07085 [Echinicola jeungdonensis]|uniref:Uncharacterized protein n=1 Tax=Echinicola jeungdonensis TaxID=709343 RepID=A0ABV5J9E6_9BACT|nr:hypothetical protein [Echinicola jeungdonensis]MDN3669087.1 hypothetical protein [Echinicola jeungdonensis]